jgi:thiaminase
MALAPCLVGYGAIARRLYDDEKDSVRDGNRFWKWVENYVADDYTEAVKIGSGTYPPLPRSARFPTDSIQHFWKNT